MARVDSALPSRTAARVWLPARPAAPARPSTARAIARVADFCCQGKAFQVQHAGPVGVAALFGDEAEFANTRMIPGSKATMRFQSSKPRRCASAASWLPARRSTDNGSHVTFDGQYIGPITAYCVGVNRCPNACAGRKCWHRL